MLALAAVAAVGAAHAITFSNATVTGPAQLVGTLGSDYFINTGAQDIDFIFTKAIVGDNLPLRVGAINITFIAESDVAMQLDKLTLSFSNILLGSGHIRFEEVVEDLVNPGIIAAHSVDLYAPGQVYTKTLMFDRVSEKIKVKKTIFLDAFDSIDPQVLDLAGIGIVEQKIELVPEPASMIALGLGLAAVAARRRRK